jgi:tetratricopeptide (TPR) repeat protein
MWKEDLKKYYIAPFIVGIFLISVSGFGINSFLDHQETKTEINYHLDKAELFYNNSQFVEAIEEYKHIQEISYNKFPYEYAMAQNNLGNAYLDLAKVRDKEVNAQNAINAYQEALKIYTVEKYPINYAMAQNNLGNAYLDLVKVRDKEVNAQNAVLLQKIWLFYKTSEKHHKWDIHMP